MIPSLLFVAALAMQSSRAPIRQPSPTPGQVCGPNYHSFEPDPTLDHPLTTLSPEDLLSSTLVEGVVLSKWTRAEGPWVQNDVNLSVTKVLRGTGLSDGSVITIQVLGGYSRAGTRCLQDTVDDGGRIEIGKLYLIALDKEAGTSKYRANGNGSWVQILQDGSLIPLTPVLRRNHALSDEKIENMERLASRPHSAQK